MAAKELMGWVPSMKRWQKRYKGKLYTVSPRRLGVEPRTKSASRDVANEWWEKKRAEIDEQAAPAIPEAEMEDPELRLQFPIPPEIIEIAEVPEDEHSDEQRLILAKWKQKVADQVKPHIRGFKDYCRDEPTDMSLAHHVQRFLDRKLVEVDAGEITSGRYESYRCEIEAFQGWVGAESAIQAVSAAILEDYLTHLQKEVSRKAITAKTAAGRLNTVKQFIRGLWEVELIGLPRNIDSRKMKITVPAPKKRIIPLRDVKNLFKTAEGRVRLYLLLMLNCGFGQTDIATLRHDEVDWKKGRIQRKRSKTKKHDRVPEVNYPLWSETFQLLRHYRSNHETLALVNKDSRPLRYEQIVDGKNKVSDAIKSAYWRLQRRTKTSYPLKLFRKTSSSMIASHDFHAKYVQHFLGHAPATVADKHYVVPSQEQFDKAIRWLGRQLGLDKS
jgi:integrase